MRMIIDLANTNECRVKGIPAAWRRRLRLGSGAPTSAVDRHMAQAVVGLAIFRGVEGPAPASRARRHGSGNRCAIPPVRPSGLATYRPERDQVVKGLFEGDDV